MFFNDNWTSSDLVYYVPLFFLIITFCISVFMFHEKKLFPECAINPILFLFFSLSLSFCFFALYYHRYSTPLSAGGGKTNTFPRGCVLKKHTSNEKNNFHEKTRERNVVIKVSFGSFNYCYLPLRHGSNENASLTHLMSGSPPEIFCLASSLHSFKNFYSQLRENIKYCNFNFLKKAF